MTDCDHTWTLFTPMDDGSGRDSRHCQNCGLVRTTRDTPWREDP